MPFFSISGSDFVEMFVGVGASRVRDLFEQAKQNSPCIIFMDEIDAVGRHRGAGLGGGHDEREQTLNQLLVEMDGFEMKDNIILIAATNRPGHPGSGAAASRPLRPPDRRRPPRPHRPQEDPRGPHARQAAGAGDRRRRARRPDARLHRRRPLQPGQRGRAAGRPQRQARDHPGRARGGDHARDRRSGEEDPGDERQGAPDHRLPRDGPRDRRPLPPNSDPIHKISVISRGQALGYTISLPGEDKFLTTRAELQDTMAMTLGGRAAEEICFGEITTGASNDLEKVTATAKQMVMRFGMSEKLGPRVFGHDHGQPFLGPRVQLRARLLRRDRPRDRRRDPPHRRGRARPGQGDPHRAARVAGEALRDPDQARDDREGAVRGAARGSHRGGGVRLRGAAAAGDSGRRAGTPAERAGREAPRPLPRPGLAGGSAE